MKAQNITLSKNKTTTVCTYCPKNIEEKTLCRTESTLKLNLENPWSEIIFPRRNRQFKFSLPLLQLLELMSSVGFIVLLSFLSDPFKN